MIAPLYYVIVRFISFVIIPLFYSTEQQKKDLEREAQQKKVKDLEELRLKQEKEQELLKNTGLFVAKFYCWP